MTGRRDTEHLLDEAQSLMSGVVARMRARLETWDIEKTAFGVEDPMVIEAERKAEEDTPEPPTEEHPVPGHPSWRDVFRKNWPEDKPKRRRRWRT